MRRVVVTGLGVVSPLGRGVKHNWESLIAGKSGIRPTQGMDLKDIPVTISGQVPFGENEPDFNPDTVIAPKDQKKNDKYAQYACKVDQRKHFSAAGTLVGDVKGVKLFGDVGRHGAAGAEQKQEHAADHVLFVGGSAVGLCTFF